MNANCLEFEVGDGVEDEFRSFMVFMLCWYEYDGEVWKWVVEGWFEGFSVRIVWSRILVRYFFHFCCLWWSINQHIWRAILREDINYLQRRGKCSPKTAVSRNFLADFFTFNFLIAKTCHVFFFEKNNFNIEKFRLKSTNFANFYLLPSFY